MLPDLVVGVNDTLGVILALLFLILVAISIKKRQKFPTLLMLAVVLFMVVTSLIRAIVVGGLNNWSFLITWTIFLMIDIVIFYSYRRGLKLF